MSDQSANDACNQFLYDCRHYTLVDCNCGHTVDVRTIDNIPPGACLPLTYSDCMWCLNPDTETDHFHVKWREDAEHPYIPMLIIKSAFSVAEASDLIEMAARVREEEREK